MKKIIILSIAFIILNTTLSSQTFTISGYIEDSKSGERLIGVNIYDKKTMKGTWSNNFGFYSISFPENKNIDLSFSFVGYKNIDTNITINKNLKISILLEQNNILKKINITKERYNRIENKTEVGTHQISMEQIKMLPSLTGEKDIMRAYQLMPGVQTGSEGTTGLYIRGGSPDQNLILLDDIPLYYINHLGGFFSVFDPDIIKTTKLIKGGFPARYGGRISAVFDVRMDDGNKKEYKKKISVGVLSTKFLLEGPIKKDKTSFIVSLRRCNLDALTIASAKLQNNNKMSGYTFYDFYVKINYKYSDKGQLFFSLYNGNDKLFFNEITSNNNFKYINNDEIKWGNFLTSIRWYYRYNSRLYSNFTFAYTRFKYKTNFNTIFSDLSNNKIISDNYYSFSSGINDFIVKIDSDYYPDNKNKVKFGISTMFHTFNPSILKTESSLGAIINPDTLINNNIYAIENSAYIEDEIKIIRKLPFNIGVHASSYHIKNHSYYSIQPRLVANIKLTKKTSIKTAYSYMTQYLHLLSSTGAGLPTDLWVPSTEKIKPENSNLYSFAFVKSFLKTNFELSIETFYKSATHLKLDSN